MNEPRDPNATLGLPSVPADSPRTTETYLIPERAGAAASTESPDPGAYAPADALPVVPGYRVLHEIARGKEEDT